MPDTVVLFRQDTSATAFQVAGPRAWDKLSGALQSAYWRRPDLPPEFLGLLAALDRLGAQPD